MMAAALATVRQRRIWRAARAAASAGEPRPPGAECAGDSAEPPALPPFGRRAIAIGGVVFAVLMALSPFYSFHRDELYLLDCARHLQASYVDQPILTPLLARLSLWLFGVSVTGLRLWPALAGWATMIIGGLTTRELGGDAARSFWPARNPASAFRSGSVNTDSATATAVDVDVVAMGHFPGRAEAREDGGQPRPQRQCFTPTG
jgi:hypothetical protein